MRVRNCDVGSRTDGTGAGHVVLVHGIGASSRYWLKLAAELARTATVHTAAPLGCSRGRIDRLAALVQEYLVNADLTGAVLVAHSQGGPIGDPRLLEVLDPDTPAG